MQYGKLHIANRVLIVLYHRDRYKNMDDEKIPEAPSDDDPAEACISGAFCVSAEFFSRPEKKILLRREISVVVVP